MTSAAERGAVVGEAAFRHFFTRLSTADLALAASAQSSDQPTATRDALATECYVQLHSSLPQIHAHHLDALCAWVRARLTVGVGSVRAQPPLVGARLASHAHPHLTASDATFELTPRLLDAVRAQARLPPAHSRLAGGALSASVAGPPRASSDAAAEVVSEPSFAEALAAEAGRATIAMSKLRDESLLAAAAKSAAIADVSVAPAAAPIDARMHAAAVLYALLSVHTVTQVMVASNAPDASPVDSSLFLAGIPCDLAAAERLRLQEDAEDHARAPVFEFAETAHEEDSEEAIGAVETANDDDSDDGFEADPLPPDSDAESDAAGAWGSLADLPSDAQELERTVLAAHPQHAATWPRVQQRVMQLVTQWDMDIFTMRGVFDDADLAPTLLSLWRSVRRHRHMFGGGAAEGDVAACAAREHIREQVLLLLRAQMMRDPRGIAAHLHPCVQEVLELPQRIPGMADPDRIDESEEAIEAASNPFSPFNHLDAPRTLLSLLAHLCTGSTSHPFPSAPGATSPSAAVPVGEATESVRHLHRFIAFNLSWLARRLRRWRSAWVALVETGVGLAFEPTMRSRVHELRDLCQVIAFFTRHAAATTGVKNDEVGAALMRAGIVHHLVALTLMNSHPLFHAHRADAGRDAYCDACVGFEDAQAHRNVVVDIGISRDGAAVCAVRPYESAIAPTSQSPFAASGTIAVPAASPTPNPLSIVHSLLLLLSSVSPTASRLLYAHPVFFASLRCACFEDRAPLVAALLPVFVALQTRELTTEEALEMTNSAPTSAVAPVTEVAAKPKKVKKSPLVVAALPDEDGPTAVSSAAADTAEEMRWSANATTPTIVLAALRRTLHILTAALACLGGESVVDVSSIVDDEADATIARAVELLQHVVHFVVSFGSSSPSRRLTLNLLSRSQLPSRTLDASRADERQALDQVIATLFATRAALPAVAKRITAQLQSVAHGASAAESAAAAVVDATDTSPDAESRRLTARDLASESPAARAARHRKTRLEATHTAVTQMQQWLKTLTMEVAKKD